jgi:ribosomal protein S6
MADKSQAEEASSQATTADSSATVKNTTPVYEIGFHVVPTVGDEGVSGVVESVRKALGDAEIIAEGFPQKMALAYQVERATQGKREKYTESYFGHIKFAMEREGIVAFTEAVRALQPVLRFLIIETVREDAAQAPRRAVFSSDRLEGKTIEKPVGVVDEKSGEVSEAELDKSIEALTG